MKFENELFSFSDDGSEVIIKENKNKKTPLAWTNILTNKEFGTIVTEGMGGFTWYKNSGLNKITSFSNDPYIDKSSDYFTIKEEIDKTKEDKAGEHKKEKYSLDVNNMPDENNYIVTFGFGYAKFEHESENLKTEMIIFVPINENSKIYMLKMKNKTNEKIKIEIEHIVKFENGENIDKTLEQEINSNEEKDMAFAMEVESGKERELENNNEKNNIAEKSNNLERPEKNKKITIVLKEEFDSNIILKYKEKLIKTKEYWKELVRKCKVKTPEESFDIMQNGWLVYQTIASRLYAKAGFYQVSGAYGFRDQMQDAICMKLIDINILKKQILLNANHQFLEGDVMHWWHEDRKIGIRTRYSDDLLFLPLGVAEYIDFTGDYLILQERADYIETEELKENEKDRVINYENKMMKEIDGTILEHCIKAIDRACKFGEHNLPLMQGGDWSDGMNRVGLEGKGESIWLGFFLYYVLGRFIKILKEIKNKESKKQIKYNIEMKNICDYCIENEKKIGKYNEIMRELKLSLNNIGWDGKWFRRAIDDKGNFVGSRENEECKIDNEVQAWSVISGAADNDKKYIAMQSLEDLLVDEKSNLVKLLTPPLDKIDLGYISSYPKGIRENGGQYTHSVLWDGIAMCLLNRNDEAYEFLKKANPIEHTKNKEALQKYKVEPYVVSADIYSEGTLAGHGGWTWYTGSSGWMYELQTKYILGIKVYHNMLEINPHVPSSWDEFEVTLKHKNAIYNIKGIRKEKIRGKLKQEKDVKLVELEGDNLERNKIQLKENGNYNIKIYF